MGQSATARCAACHGAVRGLPRRGLAPGGVIHFAGDGTSYRPGFMHGAVASARRVVAEIAAASEAKFVPPLRG